MQHSMVRSSNGFYIDKIETLRDVFGRSDVTVSKTNVTVGDDVFPIVDDVIVLLDPRRYSAGLSRRLGTKPSSSRSGTGFAEDVQFTFGAEWESHPTILPEYEEEFRAYFDLVDVASLSGLRVCDLGCGMGRWSHFLRDKCRELILVDFSDAIFVARQTLRESRNALFFMADITTLPFRPGFADFMFSLGVLHHLPVPALCAARDLGQYAPQLLVYLYYSLDNRPVYFRVLLKLVTAARMATSYVRQPQLRRAIAWGLTCAIYLPLVSVGRYLQAARIPLDVPLADTYTGKSLRRLEQDVYDRFFTRIEQRVSRRQIEELHDSFDHVIVSECAPFWHFLCLSSSISRPPEVNTSKVLPN